MPWVAFASAIVGLAVSFQFFTGALSDRFSDFATDITPQDTQAAQTAAAGTSWLDRAANSIYRTFCPLFTDCEDTLTTASSEVETSSPNPSQNSQSSPRNTSEKSQTTRTEVPSPNPSAEDEEPEDEEEDHDDVNHDPEGERDENLPTLGPTVPSSDMDHY